MPSISKIRLTNVVYEEGNKRYNDELFLFDGHNGAILLENGGGKTVLIQTALQAILPHVDLADRKIKNTLLLENAPAHIAIEWITNDQPRRYVVTAVSLFMTKHGLDSFRYVYEYGANDPNGIEGIPFVRDGKERKRTAERGEIQDYYSNMREKSFLARTFNTIKEYKSFIEEQYHIISSEWDNVVKINSSEGGVEAFFDDCKSTNQLFDRLLIPTVESSIVGHDQNIFAEMFEKQHTSFKNYKKLKETIEENKHIQLKLEDYVNTYAKLHNKELEYVKTKQKAKGAWIETLEQKRKFSTEHSEAITKQKDWDHNNHLFAVKSASYDILVEESAFKSFENEYKLALAKQVEKEEELLQHRSDFYSLKLAELKLERKEQEDHLKHIEVEIARLDQTDELTDYQEALEEAKRSLLGFYMEEIEKFDREKQDLTYQLNPILSQIEQTTSKNEELTQKERNLQRALSEIKGRIDSRLKDIKRLEQQLLANPNQENVIEEMNKWNERFQFLDDEIIRLQQAEKQLVIVELEAEARKEELQKELSTFESTKKNVSYQLSEIEKDQLNLINRLASLRPQWASVESVYLQQESIETRLIQQVEKLTKERTALLYRERMAYRFVDDHGDQEVFFGDPFLEQQLASWKNQFDYLVTGVEYSQSMDEDEKEKKKSYPLWPLTLVTTNKAKQQVLDKLRSVSDRLQFPLTVITTEEATLTDQENDHQKWIAPSHWAENIDSQSFAQWKKQIGNHAKETTTLREQLENEIKSWEDVLKEFTQFLDKHPYENVSVLKEELSRLSSQIDEILTNIQIEKRFIEEQRSKQAINKASSVNHRDEKQGLESKIEKGMQFLHYVKEVEDDRKKENSSNETLQSVLKEVTRVQQQLLATKAEKDHLGDRIQTLELKLQLIKEDEEYKRLQSFTPVYSGESKTNIKAKIHDLELKIRQINVTHGEWIAKRDGALKTIERLAKQMNDLLDEHSYIDESQIFPGDGKQLLKLLWDKIASLKSEAYALVADVQQRSSRKDIQKGKWETKLERFEKDFPNQEILSFTESLDEIAEILHSEKKGLTERKSYIDQELFRIKKELEAIEDGERWLDRFVEGHHFNSLDMNVQSLTSEEILDYTYNRKKFVKSITDELTRNKEVVETEKKEVGRAKNAFRDFCLNHISDIKLQQMAISGVENKQNYQDITDFKKNMLNRIEKISNYANEHIRESDKDLQLFINQIHTHLLTIVEELKQIPKKTRVKVEDDWKQIFTFSIPEWEEETGKTRIRDYIEWILQQLESDRYLNEQGVQDEGKVQKEIEMWLQSKQLLQMVMNNEVMKVSCRKVTNDNKVTTRSYSWEQSNVWSGGEKWSKNMTLFLGILNYVAEKKQHIQPNMKRHRAVILDNPFGKASSDHVLSPVFFVAEQLGFQIIALTAHAEGKFLQDYFPVIYSCRLRASTDTNKKVMTKEKWLHHAYFQDHDPKTIDRLGEMEQMVLFE